MTNRELIAELSRYAAHLEIQVKLSHIIHEDSEMALGDCDMLPAYNVRNEGTFLLIESV